MNKKTRNMIRFYTRHYCEVMSLPVEAAGAVIRAVMDYAVTGAPFEVRPDLDKETAERMNALYTAMCKDIRDDRTAADPAPRDEGDLYVLGAFKWVELFYQDYDKLAATFGAATVDRYIRYIDRAAQKTGNKNGWRDWKAVIIAAITQNWDGSPETAELLKTLNLKKS